MVQENSIESLTTMTHEPLIEPCVNSLVAMVYDASIDSLVVITQILSNDF